ncbi:MAG: magnesium transporter CorA family protein [Chloroflexi bacterium]|nr:magnesium transporter CorA family protein [Chloroflexota bacterium]
MLVRRLALPGRASAGAPAAPADDSARIEVIEHEGLRWVDVSRPTVREIEYLRREFAFDEFALEDCLSRIQRPKLDQYDGYLFLVLHIPMHDKVTRRTTAVEVDIFAGPDYIVTVHDERCKPLIVLFDATRDNRLVRDANMGRGSGLLLYRIVDRLVDYVFPVLNKISDNIETIEEMTFGREVLRTVQEISVVRRDLIAMRRIIRPQLGVVATLARLDLPWLLLEEDDYFGDIQDHLNKAWDTLEDFKDVVDNLAAANDSLNVHRTNEVIKVLTVISVITLPLTLVTGIYGMNIGLPLQDEPAGGFLAFWAVMGIMVLIATSMLAVFRWRGWL